MLTPSTGIPALREDAARNSTERLLLAAQATNDVVWDWDLVTNGLQFSPSVRSVFRYGPDEAVDDIDWWGLHIHPAERDAVVAGIHDAIAGSGQFWSAEYRFIRGDGTDACVFDRGFISRDESGKAVRMVGSMFDITGRKTAEMELRNRERRFRALIDNASDAIAIISQEGKFIFASEGYRKVLGFEPAELEGRSFMDFVHEEDVPSTTASFVKISGSLGATAHTTTRCRHKDGSWRMLESHARNLVDDPAIGGIAAASRDITQQQMLEAELLQAQKMEAIGQLAGGVAHDFNNLLTVISSNVELVMAAIPAPSEVHDNLSEIRRAAGQAAVLTRQLLNFTQRRAEDPQVVNLNDVVNDSQGLLRRVIGEQSELKVTTSARAPLARIDRGQLEQVMMNLVFNARDALEHGGQVEVSTERRKVHAGDKRSSATVPPGEYSVLLVSDTGEGMTRETRARAFDPFYTTKEIGKGSGLGLAMVYTIVKRAGGYIDLQSSRGAGTTFGIFLPRVISPNMTALDGTPVVRSNTGSETILLVEDEEMVRKVVRRTLAAQGYEVIEATNGREALELALTDPSRISLVLTDVMMPIMGGPELARQLWAAFPEFKIIFLSGYAPDTVFTESALPPGAILVEKPFAIENLIAKVREVIDGAIAGTARAIDMPAKIN